MRLGRKASLVGVGSAALFFIAAPASAAVVSILAFKDAMICGTSASADTNKASGKGPGMFVGADGSLNRNRSLIQFDIADSVPAGAQITGATLTLILGQVAGSGSGGAGGNIPTRTINLFALNQDWGEGTSGSPTTAGIGGSGQGYPRVAGDSSWDFAMYDSASTTTGKWNNGGSDVHGGNFASVESASSTFTLPYTVNTPYTWSAGGMVSDVQHWLDAPGSNHGWLLKAMNGINSSNQSVSLEDTVTSFLGFWTKDGAAANSNPALAPSLQVTYTVAPEPASLAVLTMLSAAGLIRRRRK
jgi:hypothetical protein